MPRGSKKFDDFKFEIEGQQIIVPVRLIKSEHGDVAIQFRAEYAPAGIIELDTDINKLRETMLKEIQKYYKIDWKLHIMVITGFGSSWSVFSARFGYTFYTLGKTPDGKDIYVEVPEPEKMKYPWNGEWNMKYTYGRHPVEGFPKEGIEQGSWKGEQEVRTLLPATIENVNAVLKFEKAFQALAEEMKLRFGKEGIEDTIDRILKSAPLPPMLPAKKEGDDDSLEGEEQCAD